MSQPAPETPIAVMLVDDHLLVRRGFRRMLEDDPTIRIVAEAGDGEQAVDLALRERPHVIVMDFALPSMNGALATRRILAAAPEIRRQRLSSEERHGPGVSRRRERNCRRPASARPTPGAP